MRPSHMAAVSCALTLLSAASPTLARPSLVSQLPAPSGGNWYPSNTSVFRTADDFYLKEPTQITAARWWGGTLALPPPPSGEAFSFRIFKDANLIPGSPSIPGTLLNSITIPAADIVRTPTDLLDSHGDIIFEYSAPLSLNLPGNQPLWLSITHIGSGWIWYESNPANGISAYEYPAGSVPWSNSTGDVAYEFLIPAPTAAAPFILTSALFLPRRRRA